MKLKEFKYTFEAALKHAFSLLNYRDRSEREMYGRLNRKGFPDEVTQEAISYLKERRFIDDKRFAELLKRDATERKYLGRDGVRNYLLSKGISTDIADELSGHEEDYLGSARIFVEKKLKSMKNYDEKIVKRRLRGLLLRRGFSYDTAYKVIKNL